ncbi:MAG: creatininase family protein [Bryobacterales bacterium]|nr:creatininase family protein [Bryobacterales bacterium]
MPIRSPLLGENTRRDFRTSMRDGSLLAALLPVAATEQHNEHLAMHHDTRSVELLALKAAQALFPKVIVCPAVSVGVSGHWMDHPGTLSLSVESFTGTVSDILSSLCSAGLRKVLIVNGHGGNRRPIESRLAEWREKYGPEIEYCSYWEAYSEEFIQMHTATGEVPGHAAEFETSVALAEFPESVHFTGDPYPEAELRISDPARATEDRRFFHGARHASAEKGRIYTEHAVAYLVTRLHRLIGAEA